jgi:hypothetical protein
MNSIQVNTSNQNELKDYKIIEVNLSSPTEKIYAVVTPVKLTDK